MGSIYLISIDTNGAVYRLFNPSKKFKDTHCFFTLLITKFRLRTFISLLSFHTLAYTHYLAVARQNLFAPHLSLAFGSKIGNIWLQLAAYTNTWATNFFTVILTSELNESCEQQQIIHFIHFTSIGQRLVSQLLAESQMQRSPLINHLHAAQSNTTRSFAFRSHFIVRLLYTSKIFCSRL